MVHLTALEPEDLDLLYTIENKRDMWSVGDSNAPYSRYALRDYIVNQQNDIFVDKQVRLVVRTETGRGIGLIDLFNFSPANSRAEMGLAILKEEQHKGYATEAVRELLDYARSIIHLHQMYCIVPADNIASLTMLRSNGFTNEQTLKQWLCTSDDYVDAILLQRFL